MRGTLRHDANLPQDISSGMQHQMDLMENTFLLFLLLFLPLLYSPRLFHITHTLYYRPIRLVSPSPMPPNAQTPPHLPFASFCGMFAFLNSFGHDVFGGCHGGGKACQESCFAYMLGGKRKKYSVVHFNMEVIPPLCVAAVSKVHDFPTSSVFFKIADAKKGGEREAIISS